MERAGLSEALRAFRSRDGFPLQPAHAGPVLIKEADPGRFMAAFAQAVAGEADVFLCDPKWGDSESAQLVALLQNSRDARPASRTSRGWLMIPTGGTSGRLRFARHDSATIAAAVRGFSRHFDLPQVNAAGVLPLHHVSGLMAWLRTVLTDGVYLPLDWKEIEGGNLPDLPMRPAGWTISLVPTQLERLLRLPATATWLTKFRILFLGGGPAWPELLDQAAALKLPLSLGYGMTETAAMAVALQPAEFLAGLRSSGTVLPHAQLSVDTDGVIVLGGESLFRGYYPDWREAGAFVTSDVGRLDNAGHLVVRGRSDAVIISGGEKINPAEVEAGLRGTAGFSEVVVMGLPDAEWGQVVVAAYPETLAPDWPALGPALERLLAPAKRPKYFIPLAQWPVNSQGKVNRAEIARLAAAGLKAGTFHPKK